MGKFKGEVLKQLARLQQLQAEPAPGPDADAGQLQDYCRRQVGLQYQIEHLGKIVMRVVQKLPPVAKLRCYFAEPALNPEQRFAEIKQTLEAHSGPDDQLWRATHAKQIARYVTETVCLQLARTKNNPEELNQRRVDDDTQALMESRRFQIMLAGKRPEDLMQIIRDSSSLAQATGSITQAVTAATEQYDAQRVQQRIPAYAVQQQVQAQVQGQAPVMQQNP